MSAEQPVFAPGLKPTLEPVVSKLEKFIIYETTSFLYVVGCDKRQIEYRVLKLDRRVRAHEINMQGHIFEFSYTIYNYVVSLEDH